MPRRTNSKETREMVRTYLESNTGMSLQEIKEQFYKEYSWSIHRTGEQNSCVEWLRGLPISVHFYYVDIVDLLSVWLADTTEKQWEYINKKGDHLYWYLLAREIISVK